MSSAHVAVGTVGGLSVSDKLATVFQHFQGCDPNTANSEAGLVVIALGAIAYGFYLLINRQPLVRAELVRGEPLVWPPAHAELPKPVPETPAVEPAPAPAPAAA